MIPSGQFQAGGQALKTLPDADMIIDGIECQIRRCGFVGSTGLAGCKHRGHRVLPTNDASFLDDEGAAHDLLAAGDIGLESHVD